MFDVNEQWWLATIDDLSAALAASDTSGNAGNKLGLSQSEAQKRLTQLGPNIVNAIKKRHLLLQFISRFRNPLVILLLAASLLSAFTADLISFVIIISMVVLSVTLDFLQEYRAEKAAEALRQSVALKAAVLRDGQIIELDVAQIVVGDVVILSAGDLIPADGRLIEADDFFVNQALLTGEPYPVEKRVNVQANQNQANQNQEDKELMSSPSAVFAGTHVVSGSARMLVCMTGARTVLGSISGALNITPPATAFEHSIYRFGMLILRLTFFLVMFVLLVNLLQHRLWLESFMFALALAVGLTPELLPMVITVTLSRGAMHESPTCHR